MPGHFTLVLLQCESWWVGWVSELPSVNAHADTRDGLLDTLRTALGDALEPLTAGSHRDTEAQR